MSTHERISFNSNQPLKENYNKLQAEVC